MLRSPHQARRRRSEDGAVAVLAALLALALLVLAGMIVDLGLARDTARRSQDAADASALAGAGVLYPTSGVCTLGVAPKTPPCYEDAVATAKAYALTNFQVTEASWSACSDPAKYYSVPGQTPCISFTDAGLATTKPSTPTKVRVAIPTRRVTTGLGSLTGISTIDLTRSARVDLQPGTARSCGLCILGNGVSGLGNGDVTVTGGSVHANGTIDSGPNGAVRVTPAPNTISLSGTCPGNCMPAAITGVPTIADPYLTAISLPLDTTGLTVKSSPCTQGPGIYPATSIPNSTCNLTAGLYVLTGAWTSGNNTLLQGTGVTIYGTCGTPTALAVCTSGQQGGRLDTKNGDARITAPSSGPLAGLAVVYDRENTAGLNIQGNGNSSITGTIYAPKALLEFPGNSCVSITNGPVIVDSLYGNGNTGCVNLLSSIGATIPAPPAGASLDQ